ncbi:crk-like protein isoform X1 [Lytechinus variegatus]|uniref:crk-like protein isoform X1 n=1 Tax=Lytechinus variegatus TaxID=7654 RepID=UPI001BB10394|nr:crk-like protein isoform X1 [Lytechinus variegatus]
MADRMYMYEWYFGEIGKEQAEKLLEDKRVGTFLVRDSTEVKGGYVLSVREKSEVCHYLITNRNGEFQIGDQIFSDLPEIVTFYQSHLLETTSLVEPPSHRSSQPNQSTDQEVTSTLERFRVKYNFPGNDPEDLPARKNDILTLLKREEQQWFMMRNVEGKEGMFPSNYLESSPVEPQPGSGQEGLYTPPQDETLPELPTKLYTSVIPYAKAIQDRAPLEYDPSELKFTKGDFIKVLKQNKDGIWEGELSNGRRGVFPSSYVEILPQEEADKILQGQNTS